MLPFRRGFPEADVPDLPGAGLEGGRYGGEHGLPSLIPDAQVPQFEEGHALQTTKWREALSARDEGLLCH